MRRARLFVVGICALTVIATAAPQNAGAHGDCIALREKLSGARCKAVAACYVREATHGDDAAACVAEQSERLVRSFAREYDLRHDCPDYGDAADVVAILDAAFADIASALSLDAGKCPRAKMAAAAKRCVTLLRDCHAKAQRNHVPVDPACYDAAAAATLKAFDKAEARFACTTSDDEDAIGATVEGAVADVVSELTTPP